MNSHRTSQVIVAIASLAVAGAAIFAVAQRPPVYPDAKTAAVQASLDAQESMPSVLIDQPWGKGTFVVIGSGDPVTVRRLSLSFVAPQRGGFKVVKRASQTAARTDVTVGSLLLASSPGAEGQPAWSAAFGEIVDPAIATISVMWGDGTATQAPKNSTSYLVVRAGVHAAISVRYLDASGAERAVVPVDAPRTPGASPS